MPGLSQHLGGLIASSIDDPSELDRRAIEEWTKVTISMLPGDITDQEQEDVPSDQELDSVINVLRRRTSSRDSECSPLMSRLLSDYDTPVLFSLQSSLKSSRPNDDVFEELSGLLGFEALDLIVQILEDRAQVAQRLSEYLQHSREPGNGQNLKGAHSLDAESARRRIEETLRANADRPLFTQTAQDGPEILQHVYTSSTIVQNNYLSQFGSKYLLPLGTTRQDRGDYEEVTIPPARPVPTRATERLVPVTELDDLGRGSFPGYTSLNRIQSIVYPTAYHSNENMLICAPTGAGKTDVAMLSILRILDQHRSSAQTSQSLASTINRDDFKIIYVAPMKALASEIVRKLGKRLQWLSIRVRELTGDMQLTKSEIAETQIIVTTPEKWDVVTRKPTGEGEVASKLKLLIIDEVHLLNDQRGAVIETIVARTLRQVESSQSVIRIVGLSATLPNYVDVADFLSVNRQTGLFYFDSSFRPVPLEQHFIGVRGKPNGPQSRKNIDRVAFEKVAEMVHQGHQVMVFVHARKETVKTAMALKEAALAEGVLDEFSCEDHPSFSFFKRDIGQSRNKEMKELFNSGFGIHHAGMLRSDRNMMERMFDARAIKVLCCTATLAWGINLPAHAVIIKGTQLYDASKGSFVDLSVLDVLQVFGRAGRPGLEDSGVAFICTTQDKLDHYLDAVTSQTPIESKFTAGMIDSLNAEISLGTVASVRDAVQWLGYTYLFVRMKKNPFQYGMAREAVAEDPLLGAKRNQLVIEAATRLAQARMIAFEQHTEQFTITDLGRIAAKYYIRYSSIEIFNEKFRPQMTEADVLAMLCMSTEFDQIQVRENEVEELKQLMEAAPCTVKDGTDTSQGKVNILLQAYISNYRPEDFALVSDQAYAAQNGGRIVRALLEIAISRKWANVSAVLMGMSKAIEKRLWPFDQPLKQFELKAEIFYNLQRFADDYMVAELAALSAAELGALVHLNERHGTAIRDAAKQFPTVQISYDLKPLGSDVLKIAVRVARMFNWSSKVHGSVEPFWLWIEDHESLSILQLSHLIFRQSTEALDVDFIISIPGGKPSPSVIIRFVSDRWMGAEEEVVVPFDDLLMPTTTDCHSFRLDLPFLSLDVLGDDALRDVLSPHMRTLNAIQSQVFWSLTSTRYHSLLCAPTGCGKSMVAQLALWKTLQDSDAGSWVLVVVPRRSFVAEYLTQLRSIGQVMGVSVDSLSSDAAVAAPRGRAIRVIAAASLQSLLSKGDSRKQLVSLFAGLRMVLMENLELLDPSYELAISLLLHATQHRPTRFVGVSNSLNDPADLAAWLGVDPSALHSFRPSDRDQSLTVSTHTFTIPQSAALFKAMAKPAHTAIQSAYGEPAIIFVPSRNLCRSVALDLITQCALEMATANGYLPEGYPLEALEHYLIRLQDRGLVDFINRGIAFYDAGMSRHDRGLILELYAQGAVRVLVVPHDSCWSLPLRAAIVVVMGTQYIHLSQDGEERQLRDYALEELVHMQGRAVRHNNSGYFHLFCQAEGKDTFMRFLNGGLPLESKLLETDELQNWYEGMRSKGEIRTKQDAVDVLSFTFLARRLVSNPVYYDASAGPVSEKLSRIVDRLESVG